MVTYASPLTSRLISNDSIITAMSRTTMQLTKAYLHRGRRPALRVLRLRIPPLSPVGNGVLEKVIGSKDVECWPEYA